MAGLFADQDQYFGGIIVMDADATATPGFGYRYAHGSVLLHELGHIMGLDHVRDPDQLMYSGRRPNFSVSDFGAGDLEGLRPELGEAPAAWTDPGTMAGSWAGTSSTSPRRSTTRTTCRTSATPTTPWPRTFSPGITGSAGEEVFHLTGTDEHGLNIQRSDRGARRRPPAVGGRDGAEVARGLEAAGHRLRRLHPDDRAPPQGRGSQVT